MKKNKFISKIKSALLSSVGIEEEDNRPIEEKMKEILEVDLKVAKKEYLCAQQFYENANEDCVEYAIAQLNACRAKVGWIVKQIRKLNEEIKYHE